MEIIFEKLNHLITREQEPDKYINEHFFFTTLGHIYKSISLDEKLDLMYLFTKIEKVLEVSRIKEYNIADYWIKNIIENKRQLSIISENAFQTMYYPMLAFYEYSKKDYKNSRNTMMKCFPSIEYLIKNDFPSAAGAYAEQVVNLIRVDTSLKDFELALENTIKLINYAWTGKENDLLKGSLNDVLTTDERIYGALKYYTDVSIIKLIRVFGKDLVLEKSTTKQLFCQIKLQNDSPAIAISIYPTSLKIFQEYLKDNDEIKFVNSMTEVLDEFSILPNSFQYIILEYMKDIMSKKNNPKYSELEYLINNYIETKLQIFPSYNNHSEAKKHNQIIFR